MIFRKSHLKKLWCYLDLKCLAAGFGSSNYGCAVSARAIVAQLVAAAEIH
jgi:hypothetical protein